MNQRHRNAFRILAATLVGVPVTAMGIYFIVISAGLGALTWSEGPAWLGSLGLVFALAGAIGLIGFWRWVLRFDRQSRSERIACVVAMGMGVLAFMPVALAGNVIAIAGVLISVGSIVIGLLPNNALERP
jgi:hypothetical protein